MSVCRLMRVRARLKYYIEPRSIAHPLLSLARLSHFIRVYSVFNVGNHVKPGSFKTRPSRPIRCDVRVCQYAKVCLIRSSTLRSVNKRILKFLAFLFFQISIIFRFFSARKDCQKYIYFQHLHPVLVKIRLIISTENICYCLFLQLW